MRLDFTLR
jgi:cleavage and polyadenylation specificity factor subunit 1